MFDVNDMTLEEGQDFLEQRLSEFQGQIETEPRPGMIFGQYMPVKSVGDEDLGKFDYANLVEFGDVESGIITPSTTVIEYADIGLIPGEGRIVQWALGATWTLSELRKSKKLGIDLDISKMSNVERIANDVLQMVAFIGHPKQRAVKGILRNPQVELVDAGSTQSINQMDYAQAMQFLFDVVITNADEYFIPDTLILSSRDMVALSSKFVMGDNGVVIFLKEVLERAIADALNIPKFNIKGVPKKYANYIVDEQGFGEMMLYQNHPDVLYNNILRNPAVIGTAPKNILAVESAMGMSFGGVVFTRSDVCKRIKYKVAPDLRQTSGAPQVPEGFAAPFTASVGDPPANPPTGDGINASAAARALAAERGVDLSLVTGTGQGGSITKPDVEAYIAKQG